jgi:hypothetical protein
LWDVDVDGEIVRQYVEQKSIGKTLRVMRLGGPVVAMVIRE